MNPNLPVQSIMTSDLVTVFPDDSLQSIREIFSKNQFHHLPVTAEGGILHGIISREDFYKVAYVLSIEATPRAPGAKNRFHALSAKDIMTKYPLHLEPDDTVGLAADIFLANKFHALPVVEDGMLIGLVTSHDLLAFSFNSPVDENLELAEFDEE
jgi:CBS domain-containing protein